MTRTVSIPEQTVHIEAATELCFEVVAAAGTTLEQRKDREKLVEFRTELFGRTLVTTELVGLDRPNQISYRWVTGPLRTVEETIDVRPRPGGGCELHYRGGFDSPHGGVLGIIEGWAIRRMFSRAVRKHLQEAKELAEARAPRSHVFRRRSA